MMTIKIRECKTDGRVWTSRHRTEDKGTALDRALRKHFGAAAGWWPDSGLGPDYGQVVVPAGVSSYNCITGRCRVYAGVVA